MTAKDKDKKEKEKEKDGTADLPYEGLPWVSIAEAYTIAIAIYAKCLAPLRVLMAEQSRTSVSNETPRDFTHPYIHANACVQYARFLLAVWSCGGWNGETFDQLIYGGVPLSLRKATRPTPSTFITWCHDSGVRRNEIAAAASQALTLSVSALKPRDRVAIISSMTSIFGCIGFVRRETYLLRQLQGAVLAWLSQTLLLHGRLRPQANESLRIRLGEVAPGMSVTWNSSPQRKSDYEAIMMIAIQICESYGINVDREPLIDIPEDHVLAKAKRARRQMSYGNPLLAGRASRQQAGSGTATVRPADANGDFGWIEQQIMLLKDTIGVAETIEDPISMAFFASLLLRDYHQFLAAEEQWRLAQGLLRIWGREKSASDVGPHIAYWGPSEPVCRFEMLGVAPSRKVVEQSYRSLRPSAKAKDEGVAGLNNPFFWNPLKHAVNSKTVTLVQDEPVDFVVTLHNPLEVALEFTSVTLSTTGSRFEPIATEVVVPPTSHHVCVISGIPRETGNITIRGLKMTMSGCKEQEFSMCQIDDSNEKKWIARLADQDERQTKLKAIGLEARMSIQPQPEEEPSTKKSKYTLEHYISCRAVLSQPLLEVESTSLSEGRLEICEGETQELCITLRNNSSLPVDYGVFAFSDNLSSTAQAALAEGGLNPATAHALERGLIKQPILSREGGIRDLKIPAGGSLPVYIKVFGKAGCSSASVELDYAHVDGAGRGGLVTEEKTNFFTRKLSLSFPINVIRVAVPQSIDVRPLQVNDLTAIIAGGGAAVPSSAEETAFLGEALARAADEGSDSHVCLFSLDIRNTHAHELELDLRWKQDEEGKKQAKEISFKRAVIPGVLVCLVVPVTQVSLSPEAVAQQVPSLSNRQFTVAREKLSAEAEQAALVKFWYKNYIYERLSCSWRDLRTGRTGELNMRTLEFTESQLQVLKRPPLSLLLHASAGPARKSKTSKKSKGKVESADSGSVPAEEFVDISAKVTNRSGEWPVETRIWLINQTTLIFRATHRSSIEASLPTDSAVERVDGSKWRCASARRLPARWTRASRRPDPQPAACRFRLALRASAALAPAGWRERDGQQESVLPRAGALRLCRCIGRGAVLRFDARAARRGRDHRAARVREQEQARASRSVTSLCTSLKLHCAILVRVCSSPRVMRMSALSYKCEGAKECC